MEKGDSIFGMITQDYQLLHDRTCFDNIALPLKCLKEKHKETRKRTDEVMEILGITGYRFKYPHSLSGGQCQQVAIARALVKYPEVLIADEPTGALDAVSEQYVLDSLKKVLDENCTIIIATHSDAVAQWCDRVVEIKDHKIRK